MNLLQITDMGDGRIQVSRQHDNGVPHQCPQPIPFSDPLTENDHRELRWYLEEFLQFPYGAERNHAQEVEGKMEQWGAELFNRAFPKTDCDPDPRRIYHEATGDLGECEISICSDNPDFLSIPWELLRDPTPGRGFLALALAGLYRQRRRYDGKALPESRPDGPFRILLIISRPSGDQDVGFGTVARPMLEALRPLRPQIELEVLRPPTFDELQRRLAAHPGYYHLVHFDGHGVFTHLPNHADHLPQFGAAVSKGHLVFEKADGTSNIINSQELGQALAAAKVPFFVLNACQSGEEGRSNPFASVASQLVAVGAGGVVAMSYSVYATSAALFMQRFYEELVAHRSLAAAIAAARMQLYTKPEHATIIGPLPLQDWMVPVLYQQMPRQVPIPKGGSAAAPQDKNRLMLLQQAEQVCPEGAFGFIGRDHDLLRIERALCDSLWVLLSGIGGTGKTELAYGFARWYAETGGCPGGAFAASFEKNANFGEVVRSIKGQGTDFSRYTEQEQWNSLVSQLRDNPCLLIWDNFETVAGYPEGTTPLASDEQRGKLSQFLKALRGGKSRVIITTRKPSEDWLGIACKLIEIGGLTVRDGAQLAKVILGTIGRQPKDFKDDREYSNLIRLLHGHPRSLEVVLPQLRTKSPKQIIDELQYRVNTGASLEDASLAYAFSQMSEVTRKYLPLVGLFSTNVDADTLGSFGKYCRRKPVEERSSALGDLPEASAWERVLEEANRNGFLRSLGSRIYGLHPTLPPFLRKALMGEIGEEALEQINAKLLEFYAGFGTFLFEQVRKGDSNAKSVMAVEEGNFLRALRFAEARQNWGCAQAIAQTLNEFYEIQGRLDEWRSLRSDLLRCIGREMAADSPKEKAALWRFLLGEEASDALARGEFDAVEDSYLTILRYLTSLGMADNEPKIAVAYHQLGMIAQERQQFDRAEQWYRKALEIYERLGLERDAADDYHQLGMIAQERRQFDRAEEWYRKALEIFERPGLERDAASAYHQLGNVCCLRQQFDRAEQWYRKALEIYERLGLERDAVDEYHQLGIIAQERRQFDRAEEWYKKALEIYERLGLERDIADEYHQLGNVCYLRQQFDRAEEWYKKALEIFERLGLERDAATDYHQLGIIAEERQQFDRAEEWYKKALEIFERLNHPPLLVSTLAQLGVMKREQKLYNEAISWLGQALFIANEYPMGVMKQILFNLTGVMILMGEEAFRSAWQESFPDREPPMEALEEIAKQMKEES